MRELEGKGRRRRRAGFVAAVLLLAGACSWVPFDFNGDKKADVAWVLDGGTASSPSQAWWRAGEAGPFHQVAPVANPGGQTLSTDGVIAVPGDYDGNGIWEPATVLVPSGTTWDTAGSRGAISFPPPALPTTTSSCGGPRPYVYPVPADYDGDGKTDPAWYRETDGTWWIAGQPGPVTFGDPWPGCPGGQVSTSYDMAVPADYDGDKKADLAVYNPQTRHWRIRRSSDGVVDDLVFGKVGDLAVPADYDGDGKADRATYGLLDDTWRIAGRGPVVIAPSPTGTRLPAPANYDGNPGAEPAELDVYSGSWFVQGQPTVEIGAATAYSFPWRLPAAYPSADRFAILRLTFLERDCDPRITPPASQPAYCSA